MELLNQIPVSTVTLVLISSSLVLTVLIGGTVYLLRSREKKAAEAEKPAPAPVPEVIKPKEPDADIMSWEAELALKISRLEEAFQQLSRRLSMAESSARQKQEVEVLAKRQQGRRELLPAVLELDRRGFSPAAIAKQLKLSDEQVELLMGVSLTHHQERTVGA